MNKADIPFLTAAALADQIRERQVSSLEATEAYLARIDEVDDKLNSYITVCADEALSRGDYMGPLHGVPFAVKDQFWTKGVRTTCGSTILSDFVPDEDATVVDKLKQAGAVLLGKLNMSEFATGNSVVHPYGTPRNPWAPERSPGTSSSGSGAATVALLCATSLGEDTGGSIRNPASNSGGVGLRPTWGLVSRYGMVGASWSMDIGGPISRTVEDCAITLQAIAGYDERDNNSANLPVPDYRAGLDGQVRGVRIGVMKQAMEADFMNPEVKSRVAKAIADLGELGADISEVSIPMLDRAAAVTSSDPRCGERLPTPR